MARLTSLLLGGLSSASALAVAELKGLSHVAHGQVLLMEYNADLEGRNLAPNANDNAVTRVTSLLKDMDKNLKKEKEEDVQANKKLEGWCIQTKDEKTAAIAKSQDKIAELDKAVKGAEARKVKLATEIQELKAQSASAKKTIQEATALRANQKKKYLGEVAGVASDLAALQKALAVLEKKKPAAAPALAAAFLQTDSEVDGDEVASLSKWMHKLGYDHEVPQKVVQKGNLGDSVLSSSDEEIVQRGIQAAHMLLQAQGKKAELATGAPKEIIGYLRGLSENAKLEKDKADKRETQQLKSFNELLTAKNTELQTADKMTVERQTQLANADTQKAADQQSLVQEGKLVDETTKFLNTATQKCDQAKTSFNARLVERNEELKAVKEALEVLEGTSATSLLQVGSVSSMEQMRTDASAVLHAAAMETGDLELEVLAAVARINPIQTVLKGIDEMVAALEQQQKHETSRKAWCEKEIATNKDTQAKAGKTRVGLKHTRTGHDKAITNFRKSLLENQDKQNKIDLQLTQATSARNKEQEEFKRTIGDQTVTLQTLQKALERLQEYYGQQGKAALVQVSLHQAPKKDVMASAPEQKQFKKSAGAATVIRLLEQLVKEAKDVVEKTKAAAKQAEDSYQKIVKDTKDMVSTVQKDTVEKTVGKTNRKKDRVVTQSDLDSNKQDQVNLVAQRKSLGTECDPLIKGYQASQASRKSEIEALQQAKTILGNTKLAKK